MKGLKKGIVKDGIICLDEPREFHASGTAVEIDSENEEESYYESHYERHESREITDAFLRVLRSMPVERGERPLVYTDEELEAFS